MFDIYKAINSNGGYKQAERLGDEVNSDSRDMYPYIAPDESYNLFSSNRPGGTTLFFARSFAVEKDRQFCDVHWVDGRVIEELRSKH